MFATPASTSRAAPGPQLALVQPLGLGYDFDILPRLEVVGFLSRAIDAPIGLLPQPMLSYADPHGPYAKACSDVGRVCGFTPGTFPSNRIPQVAKKFISGATSPKPDRQIISQEAFSSHLSRGGLSRANSRKKLCRPQPPNSILSIS